MTRMVSADGRVVKGVVSEEEGSNVKGMVDSRPLRVVAANLRLEAFSWGMRNWETQPAPRIRIFTIVFCRVLHWLLVGYCRCTCTCIYIVHMQVGHWLRLSMYVCMYLCGGIRQTSGPSQKSTTSYDSRRQFDYWLGYQGALHTTNHT